MIFLGHFKKSTFDILFRLGRIVVIQTQKLKRIVGDWKLRDALSFLNSKFFFYLHRLRWLMFINRCLTRLLIMILIVLIFCFHFRIFSACSFIRLLCMILISLIVYYLFRWLIVLHRFIIFLSFLVRVLLRWR